MALLSRLLFIIVIHSLCTISQLSFEDILSKYYQLEQTINGSRKFGIKVLKIDSRFVPSELNHTISPDEVFNVFIDGKVLNVTDWPQARKLGL